MLSNYYSNNGSQDTQILEDNYCDDRDDDDMDNERCS
jgi:hypothetical protein